jgi:exodeoxyribonuclease VII large subunit
VQERTYGVAELSGDVGRLVAAAFPGDIWVRGQIRDLKRPPSGHVYFQLAEPGPAGTAPSAAVAVVLFATDKQKVNRILKRVGAVRMEDGVEVRLRGRAEWYPPRGQLQVRMTGIDPEYTLGRLAEDRDRLLMKLRADGVFDRNQALAMPVVPLRVGLVTSVGSAAHADFLHELEVSGLAWQVTVADARTQGVDAGRSVAGAIIALGQRPVDVIAVVRGGGSRTDLAPFDGELIARAITAARQPVLTGIGHEVDTSVADLVAHTRCKTPTACAATLVQRAREFLDLTTSAWRKVSKGAQERLGRADRELRSSAERAARATRLAVAAEQRRLDAGAGQLVGRAAWALQRADERVATADLRARTLDPAAALARGWSITRRADGRLVRSAGALTPGDRLATTLADGVVHSRVDDAG